MSNDRDRLSAILRLATRAHEMSVAPSVLLAPEARGARVRLGITEAEAKIPFVLGERWRQLFDVALKELAYLYVARNRKQVGEEAHDRLLLGQEAIAVALPPPVLEAPPRVQQPGLRRVLAAAAHLLPGLDAGVLMAWWGSEGRGRPLLTEWSRLMARATAEMAATGGEEDTIILVQWMIRHGFGVVPALVSGQGLRGLAAAEVQTALAVGLHLTHRVVLENTVARCSGLSRSRAHAVDRWRVLVSPELALQATSSRAGHLSAHPFSLDASGLLPDLFARVAGLDATQAATEIRSALIGSRDLRKVALSRVVRHRLIRLCTQALFVGGDPAGVQARTTVLELRRKPEKILPIVSDRKARGAWVRQLELAAASLSNVGARAAVEGLAAALKKARPDRPPSIGADAGDPLREAAVGLLLQAGGLEACRAATPAAGRFDRRSGTESDRSLAEEHAAGRLYLIDVGERVILKAQVRERAVGHLFTDMKDFTRRTSELKEAVTAEFLRTEFYGPILGIAREYYQGLVQLSDRGGVYLNNLLGDAVSLSGEIVALVEIAQKIRRHLRAYARSIDQRLPADDEVTRRKAELCAGTFLAHGAPPAVVTFQDELWGEIRVSIAERINESARGCARNAAVGGAIDAELDFLRRVHDRPDLKLPFSVYVRDPDTLPLMPAQALAISRARKAGQRDRLLEIFRIAAEARVQTLLAAGDDEEAPGQIYNAGEALSGEALLAFRQQLGGRARIIEGRVRVEALESALLERFAFLEPELDLLLVERAGSTVLFRRAGRVRFKGFEVGAATEVFEIVDLESEAGEAMLGSAAVHAALR